MTLFRRHAGLAWICSFALLIGCASSPQKPAPKSSEASPQSFVVSESHSGTFNEFAVAADETQASAAGAEILAQGGNAADAAAATMLALGVSSFASSGLGGGGFALYYNAKTKSFTFLDFRETAPSKASADMFVNAPSKGSSKEFNTAAQYGGLAVGVPGEPAGIEALLKEFGTLSLGQIAAPAIRLAEEGFHVSENLSKLSQGFATDLAKDAHGKRLLGTRTDGFVAGSTLKRPELGKTLRTFAKYGATPFYTGAIADSIIASTGHHGGILQKKDFASYQIKKRTPLSANAFGYQWVSSPPPSAGGYILLSSLSLLERWSKGQEHPYTWWLHAFAESLKGPFIDRAAYFGDPDFVNVPLERLFSAERMARRAKIFNPNRAVNPNQYALPLQPAAQNKAYAKTGGGTTHLCVVDKEGNVAAVTTTINLPFGSRITADGMFLNNQMDDFASPGNTENAFLLSSGEVNFPAPNKRPVSSATPTIVLKDGQPVMCIGGVGGSRIITSVLQTAYYTLLDRQTPGDAVAHARIHHQAEPNVLFHESMEPDVLNALKRMGYKLETSDHYGVVQLIQITDGGKRLHAASDPRKGGHPAGR